MTTLRQTLSLLILSALSMAFASCAHTQTRQDAFRLFAAEMEQKHGIPAAEVETLLASSEFRDDIIAAITRPAEAKPWHEYRPIFIQPKRIEEGVRFWKRNEALLDRVALQYGIPPEIIVAIIGIETRYGQFTGRHRVLDSLTTLAFGYPPRGDFFRGELEQFLLLCREESLDPHTAMGSYAGAMGKPQFISSSYRQYAVDHDGDGKRDLWSNDADIIASVANYFKRHGWHPGEWVALPLQGTGRGDLKPFVEAGMQPSIPLRKLLASGLQLPGKLNVDPELLGSLIQLEAEDRQEYWVGLHNFYVITRYNHSNLYAMAAYQLSREIGAAKQREPSGISSDH